MRNRIKVVFFQRKPRPGFSFSFEHIFSDVRKRLENEVEARVETSKFYNTGFFSKIYNTLEAAVRAGKINHITGETHFLNLLMRKNTVVLTIHDCNMMLRKKGFAKLLVKLLYLSLPVKASKYVTCVSAATKREIIKYTGCSADKITIIPVAVNTIYQPHLKEFNRAKPNILHIGTADNKNLLRLIDALEGVNCHLTVVGKLNQDQVEALSGKAISYSNVYNVSDEELFEKYKECDILAFVSTFEGFGMPIIEANSVERAVITGNLSSMPEIAGNAAHLVDPLSVDEIRNGISKLINDQDYREKLIDNGRRNKLRFDADKIARSYFDLYCKIHNKN